ncbi:hypothetical protein [Virgibacillus oceani]|uniref:Phospholipase D-like domain-containing protein n=1 Tax=Virgibacillus oceani TaxID=1479511 RepID=A0A917M4F6_9BACI|nr:hypothetical protein [Virgibacillus oceani]GGG76652.1 hypothetical protein GCM10011398_22060 [Virgibacillus oceani]
MAKVNFLMQGLKEKENHRNNLKELIEMEDAKEIILSSAFLTSDGVYVLKDSLLKNKDKITVYVGCRNGITSKQGVSSLLDLGITTFVVDTGSRGFIFHPKASLAIGSTKALSNVGSANLTYGGLINNIESSTIIELDINNSSDKGYVDEFLKTFNNFKQDYPENVFSVNTNEVVERLFDEGRLVDETSTKEIVKGKSKGGKRIAPTMVLSREHVSIPRKASIQKPVTSNFNQNKNQDTVLIADKGLRLIEEWKSKKLTKRDLNIPKVGGNTHVTGSMLLKKGQYDVDQQVYFREDVFANLEWAPKPNKPDHFHYTKAGFYFVIEGVDYGKYELELKHDIRTNTKTYEQRQPMTHLLWGDARELVVNENLLGKELTLYSVRDTVDEYLIEIDAKTEN